MTCQLYRAFDREDVLLYVGISYDALIRLKQHGAADWFEHVAVLKIENHESRNDAMDAERQAIQKERPLYNKTWNWVITDTQVGGTAPCGPDCDCNKHYPIRFAGNPKWNEDYDDRDDARRCGLLAEWYSSYLDRLGRQAEKRDQSK